MLVLRGSHIPSAQPAGLSGPHRTADPRVPAATGRACVPQHARGWGLEQRVRAVTASWARDSRPHLGGKHCGPHGYRCSNGSRCGPCIHRDSGRTALQGPCRACRRTSGLSPRGKARDRGVTGTSPTEGMPRFIQAQAQADATTTGGTGGLLVGGTRGTGARPAIGPRPATGHWPASRLGQVDPRATWGRPIRGKRGSASGKAGAPPPYSCQSVWLAVSQLQVPQFCGQAQLPRVSHPGRRSLPLRLGKSATADVPLQVKKPPRATQRATSALTHPHTEAAW